MGTLSAQHFWIAAGCFVLIGALFGGLFARGGRSRSAGDWLYLLSAVISVCAALAFIRSALVLAAP
jgi:hypothetical protein